MKKPRILFLSANELGFEVFKDCAKLKDLEFFVLTLSKKSKVVMYDGIDCDLWDQYCSNVIKVNSINDNIVLETIQNLDLDLIILCGWRQIVNRKILDMPKCGTIAFHPTPLPKGRGPAPIINSILEGWKQSAVTLFYPDEDIDSGDIIDQSFFKIEDNDYAYDIYKKCIKASKNLVRRNLRDVLLNKESIRTPQKEEDATYLKKLRLSDNRIDIKSSPELIYRKIRAFSYPYLGAFIEIDNKKIVIDKARLCTKIKRS